MTTLAGRTVVIHET